MIQCVHLKQVVAVQETEPYLNKMTLFFQGERQSQTKPAHLQYMSEHLNLCVLIYACVSSFLYIGVCVCVCVFYRISYLFILYTSTSISTEHLEVISALCWTGWLVPI